MNVIEKYTPTPLAVNSTNIISGGSVAAMFLAITAGTITLTRLDGMVALAAFPVSAGGSYGLALRLGHSFTVTLAGGASGTLGVSN